MLDRSSAVLRESQNRKRTNLNCCAMCHRLRARAWPVTIPRGNPLDPQCPHRSLRVRLVVLGIACSPMQVQNRLRVQKGLQPRQVEVPLQGLCPVAWKCSRQLANNVCIKVLTSVRSSALGAQSVLRGLLRRFNLIPWLWPWMRHSHVGVLMCVCNVGWLA